MEKDLWILHFNDVYEVDEEPDSEIPGGFSRFYKKVTELKEKYSDPLILFSGDLLSPCRRKISKISLSSRSGNFWRASSYFYQKDWDPRSLLRQP